MYRLRSRLIGAFAAVAAIPSAYADGYGHTLHRNWPSPIGRGLRGRPRGWHMGPRGCHRRYHRRSAAWPIQLETSWFHRRRVRGLQSSIRYIVVGVEGVFGFIDPNGRGFVPSSTPPFHQDLTLQTGLYGDVTGRVGLAFGAALVYAKGGWAFFDGEARQTTTKPGYVTNGTDTFEGWTLGGASNTSLPSISLKVEYQHFDFRPEVGDQTSIGDPPIGHVYHNWTDLTMDSVIVGVNYKFGADRDVPRLK